MTAVEFLLEKYKSQNTLLFADDFEQAKEMERKKHRDTWDAALDASQNKSRSGMQPYSKFNDWYDEQFKK